MGELTKINPTQKLIFIIINTFILINNRQTLYTG